MIVHLLTHSVWPAPGGLELWTFRLARMLAEQGHRVILCVRSSARDLDVEPHASRYGIKTLRLGLARAVWEEPLVHQGVSPARLTSERFRFDFLALRNAIDESMLRRPGEAHVLISNFVTAEGPVAAQVADALGVPHIACVVGSDFSRGFRDPEMRATIGETLRNVAAVVTMNSEQASELGTRFSPRLMQKIPPSIGDELAALRWVDRPRSSVRLFSDGGYSHKKGTQVLLRAFERLRAVGIPATLTITGATQEGQESYWDEVRAGYAARLGLDLRLRSHVSADEVAQALIESDLYCSATIGEGCSLARAAALCVGIPILTTRTGEMLDVGDGVPHVFLVPPIDELAFTSALQRACVAMLKRSVTVDGEQVAAFRRYFASGREASQWAALIGQVARA